MNFTNKEFKEFREDFTTAVKELEEKFGLDVTLGNISYSIDKFTCRMTCQKRKSKGSAQDAEKSAFHKLCHFYGFEKEDYKLQFSLNNKLFELVGFNSNAPKNNCQIIRILDGASYRCNDEVIKRAIGRIAS